MVMSPVWRELPDDLLHHLTSFMDPKHSRLVCKSWRDSPDKSSLCKPKCLLVTRSCVLRSNNPEKRIILDLHPPNYVCADTPCPHRCVSATATGYLLIINITKLFTMDVFVTNPFTRSWTQLPPFPRPIMDSVRWKELLFSITSVCEDVHEAPAYKVVAIYECMPINRYYIGVFHDRAREWVVNCMNINQAMLGRMYLGSGGMIPVLEANRVYFVQMREDFEDPYTLSFIDLQGKGLTQTKVVEWENSDYPFSHHFYSIFEARLVICGTRIFLIGIAGSVRIAILTLEEQQWTVLSEIEEDNSELRVNLRIVEARCWEEEIIINLSGGYLYVYSMPTKKWSMEKLAKTDEMDDLVEPQVLIPYQVLNCKANSSSSSNSARSKLSTVLWSFFKAKCRLRLSKKRRDRSQMQL